LRFPINGERGGWGLGTRGWWNGDFNGYSHLELEGGSSAKKHNSEDITRYGDTMGGGFDGQGKVPIWGKRDGVRFGNWE